MLDRKKVYVFTKEWTIDNGLVSRTFVQGECFVLTGVYFTKLLTSYGSYGITDTSLLTLEESCKLVENQIPIDSVVRVVRFSDIGGTRWGSDDLMMNTLDKVGVVQSVGMTADNKEPWYKVKIGGDSCYYDRDSLEITELDDDETICDDCGRIVSLDDTYTTANDRIICNDCYDDDYDSCDSCGSVFRNDETSYIDGQRICDGCRDSYYSTCPHCDTIFHNDYGVYDDETDATYCSEECLNTATGGMYFHDYGYKPYPNFHKCAGETVVSGYYGVELELELDGADRADTAKDITLTGKEFVYCKRDGSLDDGIEIVSHPATHTYHMTDIWKRIIDTAVEDGMKSETSCGLHIHASRTLFGEHPLSQELTIAKVLYCFERLWDNIVIFSRRESVSYIEDWARKSDTGIKGTDDNSTVRDKLRTNGPRGRYSAVNLCNSNTIEFRIFASTTDIEDLQGSIGFVHTLIMYCNTHTIKQCQLLTWDTLTKYAFKRSPEFYKLSKKLIKVGN